DGLTYERRLCTLVILSRLAPQPAPGDSAVALPTTTAFTGIVRAPEPSGDTPPRPIPLSTSLRALPGVPSGLVGCAGHPEPCPAATGGSGFTIEIGSDFDFLAVSMRTVLHQAGTAVSPWKSRIMAPGGDPGSSRVRESPDFVIGPRNGKIPRHASSMRLPPS